MEAMHAAEVRTLSKEIERLRQYAARLIVHNDYLLKVSGAAAKTSPARRPRPEAPPSPSPSPPPSPPPPPPPAALASTRAAALPQIPPPWHHPSPAPPAEGTNAASKLSLQTEVLLAKIDDLSESARATSALLRRILARATAETSALPTTTLNALTRGPERDAAATTRALATLTDAVERAARGGEGGGGDDDDDDDDDDDAAAAALAIKTDLAAVLAHASVVNNNIAQLVQVAAILEVASSALAIAANDAERDQRDVRATAEALRRRLAEATKKTKTETKTTDAKRRRAEKNDDDSSSSADDGSGSESSSSSESTPPPDGKRRRPKTSSLLTAMKLKEQRNPY